MRSRWQFSDRAPEYLNKSGVEWLNRAQSDSATETKGHCELDGQDELHHPVHPLLDARDLGAGGLLVQHDLRLRADADDAADDLPGSRRH